MDGASATAVLNQKGAQYFDIEVGSSPRWAPARSLIEIIKPLADASAKGDAVWRQGGMTLQIAAVRFNRAETRAILLLHFTQSESDAVSAHLVIDLIAAHRARYSAILEDAAGMRKAVLEHAFAAFAQRWCAFYAMGPGGKFSEVRPRLSFVEATDAPVAISVERAPARCEPQILPEISAKLDALLKSRSQKRAA